MNSRLIWSRAFRLLFLNTQLLELKQEPVYSHNLSWLLLRVATILQSVYSSMGVCQACCTEFQWCVDADLSKLCPQRTQTDWQEASRAALVTLRFQRDDSQTVCCKSHRPRNPQHHHIRVSSCASFLQTLHVSQLTALTRQGTILSHPGDRSQRRSFCLFLRLLVGRNSENLSVIYYYSAPY